MVLNNAENKLKGAIIEISLLESGKNKHISILFNNFS